MTASIISFKPIRDQVSEEEWQARVNLAACYRLLDLYGMTDIIYNHVTVRVPGSHREFLINPYGMHYEEITASSLYKIDVDGNILLRQESTYDVLRAGFIIHSAVHMARPDIDCVIHTHTPAGTAVSCMESGLRFVNQTAMAFTGNLSYHDFEGAAGPEGERQRLADDLGTTYNMILRNHGLLACGRSVAEAFVNIHELELACKIQVGLAGARVIEPSPAVVANNAQVMATFRAKHGYEPEWKAMLRRLDRINPSYKS